LHAVLLEEPKPAGNRVRYIGKEFPLMAVLLMNHNFNPAELSRTKTVNAEACADNEHIVV